jgi:hypothetical protein
MNEPGDRFFLGPGFSDDQDAIVRPELGDRFSDSADLFTLAN